MFVTAKELYEATLRGEGILAKHAKANPDMPVFMLIAQDTHAAQLVDKWAIWVSTAVPSVDEGSVMAKKVTEAYAIAERMKAWPIHKNPD